MLYIQVTKSLMPSPRHSMLLRFKVKLVFGVLDVLQAGKVLVKFVINNQDPVEAVED